MSKQKEKNVAPAENANVAPAENGDMTEIEKPDKNETGEPVEGVEADETLVENNRDSENAKEGYVTYTLPYLPGTEIGDVKVVTFNGKNYPVPYGVATEVPLGVKEILDNMLIQMRLATRRIKDAQTETCITKIEN